MAGWLARSYEILGRIERARTSNPLSQGHMIGLRFEN
jgi:hypothetical protein